MPVGEASVVIPRPVSVVWDFGINPANLPIYTPGVIECEAITDGPLAVGTRWRGKTRFLVATMKWSGEFTQVEVNKITVFQSIEAPFRFTATTTVAEVDGGTRYTYRMESEPGLGGVFGKLAEPVVVKAYERALQSSLENAADILATG